MLNTILSIILGIIALSILIIIHELGHFLTAKSFNVYCQEFSVGFGPALIHKRRKGKETYFSLRAIPLGGYVSMYGEGAELEDGVNIPKERSIDGIARYKKAIVVSAGIILNAVLALTLFAISNICFPLVQASNQVKLREDCALVNEGIKENDRLYFFENNEEEPKMLFQDVYEVDGQSYGAYFYIVDDDVSFNNDKYVLVYYPNGNKKDTIFTEGIHLFPSDKTENIGETDIWENWELKNYPDYKNGAYQIIDNNQSFDASLMFAINSGTNEDGTIIYAHKNVTVTISSIETEPNSGKFKWKDIGLSCKTVQRWLPFGDRIKGTFEDFGNASVAIFQGLGTLFTGGIKNMSGIIGIFNTSSEILSLYTFSYYLYFWGLISVNLAIFNLLPFPGLDGWQLLVTVVEGATNQIKRTSYKKKNGNVEGYVDWKIPSKVKNIVSYIGLGLLFALMIAIVVMDIVRLI